MTYYFLVFLLFLSCSYLAAVDKPRKKIYLFFAITVTFLFFAFRIGFTPDYYNYENWFNVLHNSIGEIDSEARIEKGYQYLLIVSPSYRFVIVFHALLFYLTLFYCYYRFIDVKYWWFSTISLFLVDCFLLGNMSGMRSGFVTIFFFWALLSAQRNRKGLLLAIGLILGAFFFHRSALFMIPFLFIKDDRIRQDKVVLYSVLSLLLFFILNIFAESVGGFLISYTASNFDEYEDYLDSGVNTNLSFINLINYALVFMLIWFNISVLPKQLNKYEYLFVKLSCFYLIIYTIPSFGLSSRFLYYFLFPFIIGCVVTYKNLKPSLRLMYMGGVIIMALLSMRALLSSSFFLRTYAIYQSVLF